MSFLRNTQGKLGLLPLLDPVFDCQQILYCCIYSVEVSSVFKSKTRNLEVLLTHLVVLVLGMEDHTGSGIAKTIVYFDTLSGNTKPKCWFCMSEVISKTCVSHIEKHSTYVYLLKVTLPILYWRLERLKLDSVQWWSCSIRHSIVSILYADSFVRPVPLRDFFLHNFHCARLLFA